MAALTVNSVSIDGVAVTLAAAAGGGDTFVNDGNTIFVVSNGGGGSITVTFDVRPTAIRTASGAPVDVSDKAITVAAGATKYVGPFPPELYNNSSQVVSVSYSGVSSVTVAPLKIVR